MLGKSNQPNHKNYQWGVCVQEVAKNALVLDLSVPSSHATNYSSSKGTHFKRYAGPITKGSAILLPVSPVFVTISAKSSLKARFTQRRL